MGYARKVGWVTAGLVIGAGACYYCPGPRYNDWSDDDDDNMHTGGPDLGQDDTILSPQELQKVLCLVEMSEKPYILEAALIALGNIAAYAFNRDIIRDLGGLPIVAKILNTRDPIVKEKALIVLNNLSVNAENQRRLKIYMNQVCDDTITSRLNSSVQLAGLRLLTNMTVTNEYQHMLANSISDFFRLFSAGNEETKFQVLKLLLNLAEIRHSRERSAKVHFFPS
uniref:Armadillo repeat containing X-linked 3 n=1 Tax=Equus asinus TaxID=9793 RepID=A0A9L0KD31_EQUAS